MRPRYRPRYLTKNKKKGLRKRNFFKILGKLIMALDHSVDLVNLEKKDRFSAMLKKKGELLRVA
jgi:hypothetical protein